MGLPYFSSPLCKVLECLGVIHFPNGVSSIRLCQDEGPFPVSPRQLPAVWQVRTGCGWKCSGENGLARWVQLSACLQLGFYVRSHPLLAGISKGQPPRLRRRLRPSVQYRTNNLWAHFGACLRLLLEACRSSFNRRMFSEPRSIASSSLSFSPLPSYEREKNG